MARHSKTESCENYSRLVATAERLFSENGYRSTTLTQIANEAGLSRGAIYWHFRDKPEILAAVLSNGVFPWENDLQLGDDLSCTQVIDHLSRVMEQVLYCDHLRQLTRILLFCNEDEQSGKIIGCRFYHLRARFYLYLLQLLKPAKPSSAQQLVQVRTQARVLRTYVDGMFYQHLVCNRHWSREQIKRELQMLLH